MFGIISVSLKFIKRPGEVQRDGAVAQLQVFWYYVVFGEWELKVSSHQLMLWVPSTVMGWATEPCYYPSVGESYHPGWSSFFQIRKCWTDWCLQRGPCWSIRPKSGSGGGNFFRSQRKSISQIGEENWEKWIRSPVQSLRIVLEIKSERWKGYF